MKSNLHVGAAFVAALILACDEPGDSSSSGSVDAVAETGGDAGSLFDAEVADDAVGPGDTATTPPPDTVAPPQDTTPADTGSPEVDDGPAPVVAASCVDGQYSEQLPDDGAAIGDLVSGYQASEYRAFIDAALERRYPFGAALVRGASQSGAFDCVAAFTSASDRGSASALARQLSTVVHECGHVYDLNFGSFSTDHYLVADDLSFTCQQGDTTTRGGETFARSLLNGDAHASMHPADFYRDVYLDGDPNDGNFDGGDQGFNSVLEEATQYVNSLATDWAFRDFLGGFSISSRDGILTFLWYIERYLQLARTSYPAAYARLSEDPCWRTAILTVWGRAWLYLDLTADIPQLGLDDDLLEQLVVMPELLEEIDRLRDLHGCP